ncbi:RES domain-containing protein [Blastococcus aurantiacus]|uniref:RES domain-containing protein n=1 Tax=Blastococcus aurantiacus TaxID=1550231 RepID=UPI000B8655DD
MLCYRVFPYLASAGPGEPGHPSYLHLPQGNGRLDNPHRYNVWYLATEASGAVGETFGNISHWRSEMFDFPALSGSRRALGTFSISDDARLLDLDDARNLLERGLRPTQVIDRNRGVSQGWALRAWEETDGRGSQVWAGIRWWSFQRPHWRVLGIWGETPQCVDIQELTVHHPAVVDAANTLLRRLP